MLASRMSGLEANLVRQEVDRALGRPVVEPGQQSEREHVLGPGGVLAGEAELLDRFDGHAGQVERVHLIVVERAVGERIAVVADLGQIALGEVGGIGDDHATARQVGDIGLERCGIHRDQHIRPVAGRHDVVIGEVQLEAGDARQRAGGCPDLGWEVRQR